jgi:hypothetical protein
MEDRIITYTVIKELHRLTTKLVEGVKQKDGTRGINKEEKDLLNESLERIVKVSMLLNTK